MRDFEKPQICIRIEMKVNKEGHLHMTYEVKADLLITFILWYQILIPFIVSEN